MAKSGITEKLTGKPAIAGLTDTGRLMQQVARGQAKIPDSFWKLKPIAKESAAARIIAQARDAEADRKRSDLAVVTCYFNPCGYKNRLENFAKFYEAAVSQGADIWVIECRMGNAEWELPDDLPNLHRVTAHSWLWHKERLLNILIERLPKRYTKVAWLDCDILFDNPDWVDQTSQLLEKHHALQLFESAVFLGKYGVPVCWWNGRSDTMRKSLASFRGKERSLAVAHPGFAWAGRRNWIAKIGLWDRHIVGSGDVVIACGLYGWKEVLLRTISITSEAVRLNALLWLNSAFQAVNGNVGCVPGEIRHLWHGDRVDRRYDDRHFFARIDKFDPSIHLQKSADGCWEWTQSAPESLVTELQNYFHGRREDG